tara:strand:- start:452 stop:1321 length:870 start_codon:yes stop_codon:yes gene_type:complete
MQLKKLLGLFGVLFIPIFPLNLISAELNEENQNNSKTLSIKNELKKSKNRIIFQKNYKIDENIILGNIDVIIRPYELSAEQIPEWWSEKQAYDMSFILLNALNYYPGLNVFLEKTWEEKLLEGENISENISLVNTNNKKIIISPFVDDFKFQVLTPKTRGIGVGIVAFNRKTCVNETFLSTKYQFASPLEPIFNMEDITSKQLLIKKKSGSSLNANLLIVGMGGGKFKAPKKPIKEIIYNSIVDSAEGLYCSLTNNQECIKYYQEREYQFPTIEKKGNKRKKKKKDKSC